VVEPVVERRSGVELVGWGTARAVVSRCASEVQGREGLEHDWGGRYRVGAGAVGMGVGWRGIFERGMGRACGCREREAEVAVAEGGGLTPAAGDRC
jgi:hypothetical protein